MQITEEEYEALRTRADNAEKDYQELIKNVELFFKHADVKMVREPHIMNRQVIYLKILGDKIDGKFKGFLEFLTKTQARPF